MEEIKYKSLDQLSGQQLQQYRETVQLAFPPIILNSELIVNSWIKIEQYFPKHQIYAIDTNNDIIGFANLIPFHWDKEANELPNDGWDWLMRKGIGDHESKIKANSLGGLQIIVTKKYLGKGYSKILIGAAKKLKENFNYKNLFIPIRPTLKHQHAVMPMKEYIEYKKDNKIYDPWIRTHVNNGANIVKVCHNSMNVKGPITFWEKLYGTKIAKSGSVLIKGALSPVHIDIENNHGEYQEPNIWISY